MDAFSAGVLKNCFPAICVGRIMETERGDHKKLCTPRNNADLPHQGNYFVQQNKIGFFKDKSQLLTCRALVSIPVLNEKAEEVSGSVLCCQCTLKFRIEGFCCSLVIKKGKKWKFLKRRSKAEWGNHFPGV